MRGGGLCPQRLPRLCFVFAPPRRIFSREVGSAGLLGFEARASRRGSGRCALRSLAIHRLGDGRSAEFRNLLVKLPCGPTRDRAKKSGARQPRACGRARRPGAPASHGCAFWSCPQSRGNPATPRDQAAIMAQEPSTGMVAAPPPPPAAAKPPAPPASPHPGDRDDVAGNAVAAVEQLLESFERVLAAVVDGRLPGFGFENDAASTSLEALVSRLDDADGVGGAGGCHQNAEHGGHFRGRVGAFKEDQGEYQEHLGMWEGGKLFLRAGKPPTKPRRRSTASNCAATTSPSSTPSKPTWTRSTVASGHTRRFLWRRIGLGHPSSKVAQGKVLED